MPFRAAETFARSKKGWIAGQLEKARCRETEHVAFQRQSGHLMSPTAARKLLVDRLDLLARRHGFVYNRVFVRRQKTRWGSCSGRSNISLNINLVRLPQDLMDYIILHELMHTRILDHSPRFWAELEKIVGDVKPLNARMKQYSAMLL
jgi:predicted metal-dependent hydrolase